MSQGHTKRLAVCYTPIDTPNSSQRLLNLDNPHQQSSKSDLYGFNDRTIGGRELGLTTTLSPIPRRKNSGDFSKSRSYIMAMKCLHTKLEKKDEKIIILEK